MGKGNEKREEIDKKRAVREIGELRAKFRDALCIKAVVLLLCRRYDLDHPEFDKVEKMLTKK